MGNVDLTGGFNFTQLTSYLDYLTSDYSVYVNLLANLALEPMQLAIDATFPVIDALADLANATQCLEQNFTNPADANTAVDDLRARIAAIRVDLAYVNTTTMAYARGNISAVETSLNAFSGAANQTAVNLCSLLSFFDPSPSPLLFLRLLG